MGISRLRARTRDGTLTHAPDQPERPLGVEEPAFLRVPADARQLPIMAGQESSNSHGVDFNPHGVALSRETAFENGQPHQELSKGATMLTAWSAVSLSSWFPGARGTAKWRRRVSPPGPGRTVR